MLSGRLFGAGLVRALLGRIFLGRHRGQWLVASGLGLLWEIFAVDLGPLLVLDVLVVLIVRVILVILDYLAASSATPADGTTKTVADSTYQAGSLARVRRGWRCRERCTGSSEQS